MAATDDEQRTAAETDPIDALPPLPPIPDGGLATSMPSWLRSPQVGTKPADGPGRSSGREDSDDSQGMAVESSDVASWVDDSDLPAWLRSLVEPIDGRVSAPDRPTTPRQVTVADVVDRYAGRRATTPTVSAPEEAPDLRPAPIVPERVAASAAPDVGTIAVSNPPATRRVFLLVAILLALLLVVVALAAMM